MGNRLDKTNNLIDQLHKENIDTDLQQLAISRAILLQLAEIGDMLEELKDYKPFMGEN